METSSMLIDRVLNFDQGLRQYARSLTMNHEDASDLVQDTYMKVMQNSDYYKEDTNLKAWVYTIMKNTFINNYRRKQRSKVVVEQREDLYHLNNFVSSPSDAADMNFYVKDINEKILEKKEDQRKPFEMFLDGFKYQEIADEMNISIGTVKSRIFFTRKKLMEDLKDYVTPTYEPRIA
ncbi:RNA polymerase sigma factor [Bacteroidales bacterium OttesenSCG-928-B11]|nr:RNA polymerase sigma factor [Bacteroidales bacterium OttesenSCG-928-B11]MDL2326662.1 RNA polymerase sigma factor [Bacteroidales bacterium OttesenSCG-928-A14]